MCVHTHFKMIQKCVFSANKNIFSYKKILLISFPVKTKLQWKSSSITTPASDRQCSPEWTPKHRDDKNNVSSFMHKTRTIISRCASLSGLSPGCAVCSSSALVPVWWGRLVEPEHTAESPGAETARWTCTPTSAETHRHVCKVWCCVDKRWEKSFSPIMHSIQKAQLTYIKIILIRVVLTVAGVFFKVPFYTLSWSNFAEYKWRECWIITF